MARQNSHKTFTGAFFIKHHFYKQRQAEIGRKKT